MGDNLYELFRSRFPSDRTTPFIATEDGRTITYGDLDDAAGRYARLLGDLGVGVGDRVAVQVEKSPEAIFLYLGCLRAGAAFVPLNPAHTRAENGYFLGDALPAVLVSTPAAEPASVKIAADAGVRHVLTLGQAADGSLAERARGLDPDAAIPPTAASDLAALLYTSGTTGRSKGAMLTHGNLAANALALVDTWELGADDVLLHALPIFHTHGLFVATHCVLLSGSRMLFLPRFDADTVVGLLPRATVLMGVPTYYTRLLAHPRLDAALVRHMRLFISGSAPLLAETHRAFALRAGHAILERYGMTETGMNTSNPVAGARVAGSVGPPLPGVEIRISGDDGAAVAPGAIGTIEVRGPNVFAGYWRMAEKTAAEFRADGFFITGDLGRIDERGYVHIVGRAKDLIISGGFNVYPKEVENVIDAVAGVAESAVVGVPHPDFGEAVVAVVERRPDRADVTAAHILAVAKAELANYKVPKRVVLVDELPRNAMGKVRKNELRERHKHAFAPAASNLS